MYLRSLILVLLVAGCTPSEQPEPSAPAPETLESMGSVERLDPRLDALIPADARLEVLADGFGWSEGPVWVPELASLLFNDIPPNRLHRWSEQDGLSVWLTPAGYTGEAERTGEVGANGLILDQQGRLVLAQHGDRRIARLDAPWDAPAPTFTTVADRWDGNRFNSPNDLVQHSSGAIYFTDPPYGLPQQADDPSREIDFQGVYRVDPNGDVILLTDSLTRPNGLAFSPDESTLYVANSDPQRAYWMAFDVGPDGGLSNARVFFDATSLVGSDNPGLPDGLKVDQQGHLFATGPGGVLVLTPQGEHLGTIRVTEASANCAFGDDGQTLYITSDDHLTRIRLTTTGMGF